jgi:hypothetical protein
MADPQALLQPGEPGPAAVQGHDLPVDAEVAGLPRRQGFGDLGVGAGVLLLIAVNSRTCRPDLNARHRSLSSLRSKIHPGPENQSWVSVASSGSSQPG